MTGPVTRPETLAKVVLEHKPLANLKGCRCGARMLGTKPHADHLAAALLDAIDAGQVPGLVTAPSEPLLLRLRTMRDRYSERSTWVGFEFPRREAWREIADDLSRLLDFEDGAR